MHKNREGVFTMSELTKHEEILLISILHLKENAYGVYIRRRIAQHFDKQWNYGTLYRMLEQLVRKGLLERNEGEPMPEKGGRRKKYYTFTEDGIKALQEACSFQQALWGKDTIIALENAE